MTIRTRLPRTFAALVAVTGLAACSPTTDRERYVAGESGSATFRNESAVPLYLGGCGHFAYEKRVGDVWVPQGPDFVCVWEGFADPVPPGGEISDPIRAREAGTWRLRYPVGAGCSAAAPLGPVHCSIVKDVVSNEFEVVEAGCVVSGCSGEICAEEPMASICLWREEFACYREARCGRFGPEGACAWDPTPELQACLEELGGDPVVFAE